MGSLIVVLVALVALVVLGLMAAVALVLVKKAGMLKPAAEKLPYTKQDYFFTKAERSFYGALKQAIAGRFEIFGKVRLADVIGVAKGTPEWQRHFNRINQKHVDFLLCEPKFVAPVLVIELDDSSHNRPKGQERDKFVDRALHDAGLQVLRVPAKAGYDPAELRAEIDRLTMPVDY